MLTSCGDGLPYEFSSKRTYASLVVVPESPFDFRRSKAEHKTGASAGAKFT